MSWLSENPWPLAGTLGLLALGFLFALKLTGDGKYLVRSGIALGVALLVLVIEQLWVTDAERIEAVVSELGRAVRRSDADAVLALLTPDVMITQQGMTLGGAQLKAVRKALPNLDPDAANPARAAIRAVLRNTQFDFVTITRLETSAAPLSRRGKAEFRVMASGSIASGSGVRFNFATPTSGTDWSLGLREEEDGRWRIDDINATRLPRGWQIPLGGGP